MRFRRSPFSVHHKTACFLPFPFHHTVEMDCSSPYINVVFPNCEAIRVPFQGTLYDVRRFLCKYYHDKFPRISDGHLSFYHAKLGKLDGLIPLQDLFGEADFPLRLDVVMWEYPPNIFAHALWSVASWLAGPATITLKEKCKGEGEGCGGAR